MSQANIEKFVQQVAQDSALQEQLKPATSLLAFQSKMVELGKQKGCIFGESDVASYVHSKVAQKTGRNPDEKLTEEELESVGGGTTPIMITTITVTIVT
jgi:predicted ribosomally synthesized peptide with nif11-like leader